MEKKAGQQAFESRMKGKLTLHTKLFGTFGAVLLHLIPAVLLSLIFSTMLRKISEGTVTWSRIGMVLAAYEMAQMLIVQPLLYGFLHWMALRSKQEECRLTDVLVCFGSGGEYRRAVWAGVCLLLHQLLWAIPLAVAMIGLGMLYGAYPNHITGILFYQVIVLAILVIIAVTMQYYSAYVLMTEQQSLGVWRAFRQAAAIWKGHHKALALLMIGFGFWFLMMLLTNGLAYLYVCPYMILSVFHLFHTIRETEGKENV